MGKSAIVFIVLALIAATTASATFGGTAAPQWWPGEKPTPKAAGSLSGQVTEISVTTLTVQTEADGSPIFTVNKDTQVKGKRTSLADLAVGDKVVVQYSTLVDDNVWAKVVTVADATAPPAATKGSAFGSVTAVSSTSISLTTEKGAQTFAIVPETEVRVSGEKSTVEMVKNGDSAIVAFAAAAAGPVAKSIRVLAPGLKPPLSGSVAGKVGAIGAASITLQTEKLGDQVFGISTKTKYAIYGQKATLEQIKLGDNVSVGFSVLDNGSRVATSVSIPIPVFQGKIVSVGNDGFTLATKTETVLVAVTPETKIMTHTYVGTLADLVVGYSVSVRGVPTGGSVRAMAISFGVPEIHGVVVSASGDLIVVRTAKQKIVNVTGTAATVILVRPRTAPNFRGTPADVKPGIAVNIGGHAAEKNAMTALWIDLLVP